MKHKKLLIVGGFRPDASKGVGGGVLTSCLKLLDSQIMDEFEIYTLDSTSKSNPPPSMPIRAAWSMLRLLEFFHIMAFKRPDNVLLFTADGMSFLEKGLMATFADFFGAQSFMFLRANKLLAQLERKSFFRWLSSSLIASRTVFLCQGATMKSNICKYLGHSADRAHVVPNWTADVEAVLPTKVTSNKFSLIFVGWVTREKGVFDLLDAFQVLLSQFPNCHLSIVGAGGDLETLRQEVQRRELCSDVSMLGWIERSEIARLLPSFDLFVLPSESEGMPNSVIEAMSSGLPVVTTPVGVMPDYFTNDRDIVFVEPHNAEGLGMALLNLYKKPDRRRAIAARGRILVENTFSPGVAIDVLIDILNSYSSGKD